ncbi:hypothetical protein [Bacillus sp. JJ1474]|uniref:hypothetical protein n=1 Tax=Bacillus sp. JJ1474 TaxID=3122955 RepID=UPI002FFF38F6
MIKLGNILTLSLLLLFVISNFAAVPQLDFVIGGLTLLVILVCLPYCTKLNKIIGGVMISISFFIIIINQYTLTEMTIAISKNLPLMSLIVLVPILSIPIILGNYQRNIMDLAVKFAKKPQQIYFFISASFFFLAPIINVGSIFIIHSMVKELKLPTSLLGKVYMRGFIPACMWAPYFASVLLIVNYYNIQIHEYLHFGLFLGILQLVISNLLFSLRERKTVSWHTQKGKEFINLRKPYELLIVITLLTVSIGLLEFFSSLNIILMVTFTVILFSVIWSAYLKKQKDFLRESKKFLLKIFPDRANEIVLFLTAGFFGSIASTTSVGNNLNILWVSIADYSILLMIFFTIAFVSLFSFLGIHQIVMISIILASVSNEAIGINNIIMALTLLSSWAVGSTISSVSPPNIVISNLLRVSIFDLVLKWNLLYAIIVACVHSLVIYCIYLMG